MKLTLSTIHVMGKGPRDVAKDPAKAATRLIRKIAKDNFRAKKLNGGYFYYVTVHCCIGKWHVLVNHWITSRFRFLDPSDNDKFACQSHDDGQLR